MNYKNLGNTNLKVSTICLGTMTWGEQNSELEGYEQMDLALDYGVNFWDTAELYSVPPKSDRPRCCALILLSASSTNCSIS